jgi:hypothetical protein
MATTSNTYTGNGSNKLFSITFPYLETTDVDVYLNGTLQTAYTFANATTIEFTTAPANGATVLLKRTTDDANLQATFFPGSSIKASDLNLDFDQVLYIAQETSNTATTATATAASATTTANTALSQSATAVNTANTASSNASAAVSTANTASTNASNAVTTANTASSNASTAVTTANAAVVTANSASSSASTALSTANTALTNANNAVTTANTASSNASAAVSTANTASTNASNAVTTANSAVTTANGAVTTANTANTNANTAVTTANAAAAAVANAVLYTTVANVAAIPGSPANNAAVEVTNSTGIESFTPLSGKPAGFVGSSGLSVRIIYQTVGSTWTWIQYFPNDPENRYFKLSGGTLTGALTSTLGTAASPSLTFTGDTNTGVYSPGADQVAISTNGTGRLFVDASGRIGIGASSIGGFTGNSVIYVKGASQTPGSGQGQLALLATDSQAAGIGASIALGGQSTSADWPYATLAGRSEANSYAGYFSIATSTSAGLISEKLRITSAGLVGVGTSVVNSLFEARGTSDGQNIVHLSNNAGSTDGGATNVIRFTCNGNTNWGNARYDANAHIWNANGSERLRLDASGRLGIGVSAPRAQTEISRASAPTSVTIANSYLQLGGSEGGASSYRLITFGGLGETQAPAYLGYVQTSTTGSTLGDLVFGTRNTSTNDAASERLRITSAGNVGIGTTSPQKRFVASNSGAEGVEISPGDSSGRNVFLNYNRSSSAYITAQHLADIHIWGGYGGTGGNEAMRIDGSGRLLVGTSSTSRGDFLQVQADSGASTNGGSILLRSGKATGTITTNDVLGQIRFSDSSQDIYATIQAIVDGSTGSNDFPSRLVFSVTGDGASSPTERMRISSTGDTFFGKTVATRTTIGSFHEAAGVINATTGDTRCLDLNRQNNDGDLVLFFQAGTQEGSISVSGTTVSYNGAHLSRWSQLPTGAEREEILRGTVLSNIDEMCEWDEEDNEQLNRMKVSDVEGDKNVSGVFQAWDDDDDTYTDDFYCAMTGDFIIRIAEGVTVERGDLLMSAGNGTAKPQDDDIIRSKTIAKVTSTNVSCTYDDGSYCVPCVLMAC